MARRRPALDGGGHRAAREPDNDWWDDVTTEERETRDDVLRAALLDARDDLTRLVSPDTEDWTWGELHELRAREPDPRPLRVSALVERLFNRGGWGSRAAGAARQRDRRGTPREGYEVETAPSMRMVVSLADLDDSRWINLTGVSGHAFHPHYTDQTDLFVAGRTLPWAFSRDAVEAAAEDTLTLVPRVD